MSSTNRSDARTHHVSDYYRTPIEAIKTFLDAFTQDFKDFSPKTIFDPCCGGDKDHEASYPKAIELYSGWKDYKLGTCDIRPDSRAAIFGNFLEMTFPFQTDLVISNPPFSDAQAFVERSLNITRQGGYTIMLLRLNFFEGKKRHPWWLSHMPIATYVHSARMSFTDDGATDSVAYMHAVWEKGVNPQYTKLRII